MCQNPTVAAKSVADLMAAIEPGLVTLEDVTGMASTPEGAEAITAYNAALVAVQNYVPGTAIEDTVQIIGAFTAVFNTIPFPPEVKGAVDLISAAVVTVIGVLKGNAPAPAAPAGTEVTASAEEIQAHHALTAAAETEAKVAVLVPGFKRSMWHSPASQYKSAWKKQAQALAEVDPKYAVLVEAA